MLATSARARILLPCLPRGLGTSAAPRRPRVVRLNVSPGQVDAPPTVALAPTVTDGEAPKPTPQNASYAILLLLAACYLHHSIAGFSLPALMPAVSADLEMSDKQTAYLASGYTFLYALGMVPCGMLADRVDRTNLLAVAVLCWCVPLITCVRL